MYKTKYPVQVRKLNKDLAQRISTDKTKLSTTSYTGRIRQMVVDATSGSANGDGGNADGEVHDDTPAPTPTASGDLMPAGGDGYEAGEESPDTMNGNGQLRGVNLVDVNSSLDSDRMYFDEENGRFGVDDSLDAERKNGRARTGDFWIGTPEPVDRYESLAMDEQAVRDFKQRVAARSANESRNPFDPANNEDGNEDAADSPSPDDHDSQSTGDFFYDRPHLAKHLFFVSVALVLISLGLAAAGLGMMYTSKQNDEAREQQPEGLQDFSQVDLGDGTLDSLPSLPTAPALDFVDDVDVDEDDAGPKAKVTDEPTDAPSVDVFDPDVGFEFLGDTFDTVDVVDAVDTTVPATPAIPGSGATGPSAPVVDLNSTDPVVDFLNSTANTTTTTLPTTTTDDLLDTFNFGDLHSLAINPVADTWLEFNDTDAYGDKKRLKVDGDATRATLLKFNVSELPENVTDLDIVSVALRLYALTDSPFGGKIEKLGNHCSGWDEYNVSWTNAAKCVMRDNAQLMGQFDTVQPWAWSEAEVALNLTEDLPELITLRLTSHYANGVTYASRENATAMPELVVYYRVNAVAAIASPAPTVSPGPTKSPTPKVPTATPSKAPTTPPTKSPSYAPSLPFPTYMPTTSPSWNGTRPPTLSPSTTPEDLVIVASQDATIRGGDFRDDPLGEDPFLTLRGALRKSILEFDLSSLRPSFDYAYTLKIFVSFVSFNEQRSVTASYVSEPGFSFDEETVTWNNFGAPNTTQIGWFSIFQSDEETSVNIPLGNLPTIDNKLTIVLEILEDTETGAEVGGPGDKFDFRSREYAEWAEVPAAGDTAPTLLAKPEIDD